MLVCIVVALCVTLFNCLFPCFSFQPSLSSFTPTPLPISLSPSSSDIKVGGKVKSARNRAHYSQRERSEDGGENEVRLTNCIC